MGTKKNKFEIKFPFFREYAAVGKYGTGSVYEFLKRKFKKRGKIFLNQEIVNFSKKFEIKNSL